METWKLIWAVTFAVILVLYTGLFLWVTLGGVSDIKAMLRSLEKPDRDSLSEADAES